MNAPVKPLGIGLHLNVPHAVYHADPCAEPSLSSSLAKTLVMRSALHAHTQHPRLGGVIIDDDSDAKDRGTILDALLFGVGPEIVRIEADDFRTKLAKEARDEARSRGAVPIIAAKLDSLTAVANVMRARIGDVGLELNGQSQVTMVWKVGNVWCRARLDHAFLQQGLIFDLKTTYDASPSGIERSMNSQSADIQWAAYTSGLTTLLPELAGRERMRFVYAEPDPPYAVVIADPDGTMQELGARRWKRAIEMWDRAITTGEFPGYPREIRVAAKPWLLTQDMNEQVARMDTAAVPPPF